MTRRKVPQQGDVYWINPNPVMGHEMKDRHRFVVITRAEINAFGLVMMVPITSGGQFSRNAGFTTPVLGHETNGVALCNQVRTFDLAARVANGSAHYLETLDESAMHPIILLVLSIIDPD